MDESQSIVLFVLLIMQQNNEWFFNLNLIIKTTT